MNTRMVFGAVRAPAALTAAAAVGAYTRIAHRRAAWWRAEDDEIARVMPLDGRISQADYITNRAITIESPPDEIWLWIAQMGESPRGGFYSYGWIERMMGMEVKSSLSPVPGCPAPQIGDRLDRQGRIVIKAVEPRSYVVLGLPDDGSPWLDATWCLALYPVDQNRTRLVSRVRAKTYRRTTASLSWRLLVNPAQFAVERKMLREIKDRSEELARERRHWRETFEFVQLEALKSC